MSNVVKCQAYLVLAACRVRDPVQLAAAVTQSARLCTLLDTGVEATGPDAPHLAAWLDVCHCVTAVNLQYQTV